MSGRGVPRSQEKAPSLDLTVRLCLELYDGPRRGGLFLMSEVALYLEPPGTTLPAREERVGPLFRAWAQGLRFEVWGLGFGV